MTRHIGIAMRADQAPAAFGISVPMGDSERNHALRGDD
jgi:hypothetical protein